MQPRGTTEAFFRLASPSGGKLHCVGKWPRKKPKQGLRARCLDLQQNYTELREGAPCQFACVFIPNCYIRAFFIPNSISYNSFRNGVLRRVLDICKPRLAGRNCMVREIFPPPLRLIHRNGSTFWTKKTLIADDERLVTIKGLSA